MVSASRAQAREVLAITALSGLSVRDVLPRSGSAPVAIPAWQTVQAFLEGGSSAESQTAGSVTIGGAGGGLGGSGALAFPLRDFDGRAAGVLTLSQLALVPVDQRDRLRLADVATQPADVVTTTLDEPLGQLLVRLSIRPSNPAALHTAGHALVVADDGTPAGVLTPDDFRRASHLGRLVGGRRAP
jgi:CBS domain-containing protein